MFKTVSPITYMYVKGESFLTCLSLSGSMGIKACVGKDFQITFKNGKKAYLFNATEAEIQALPNGTYLNKIR